MPVPAPNLDDRTFQGLVDEAKRRVQQRCPSWSDHNVSDPGVTLIEAFAQMVDQLIYRLNRVPDRHYLKFLELIGVDLLPPSAARGEVTFWLSAPRPQPVLVRAGAEIATPRTDLDDPIVFSTVQPLSIVPCAFAKAVSATAESRATDRTDALADADGFTCFSDQPVPGDALLVGLTAAVPSCAVTVRFRCRVEGEGVDPENPPLSWEAWSGAGWEACELAHDRTGGLNRPGDVLVHVPASHVESVVAGHRAGWLRCRLVAPADDQPTYTRSPRIHEISAFTIGGTVAMANAQAILEEELGVSDGTPAQRLQLAQAPVVTSEAPRPLQVLTGNGDGIWQDWAQVEHFAESTDSDLHYRLDPASGEVELGPLVRAADGSLRQYGAVPPRGSRLRMSAYWRGGGRRGNVAAGQIQVLKTSVPYVARVENRSPANGGADGETVAAARVRGPLLLRSRGRAVTAEDFELLTREVAPEVARVRCIPDTGVGEQLGLRVLLVPHVGAEESERLRRADLQPSTPTLERVATYLDERRLVGSRVVVQPPRYRLLTVAASVTARPSHRPQDVRVAVEAALFRWFHPLTGGPEGAGWPFGGSVHERALLPVLAELPGVDITGETSIELFTAEEEGGRRSRVPVLELDPDSLVLSYDHKVRAQS